MLLTLLQIEQWTWLHHQRGLIDLAGTVLPEGGGDADQRRAQRDISQ